MEELKYNSLVKEETNLYARRIEFAEKAKSEKEKIFNNSFAQCQALNRNEIDNQMDEINEYAPIKMLGKYALKQLEGVLRN